MYGNVKTYNNVHTYTKYQILKHIISTYTHNHYRIDSPNAFFHILKAANLIWDSTATLDVGNVFTDVFTDVQVE